MLGLALLDKAAEGKAVRADTVFSDVFAAHAAGEHVDVHVYKPRHNIERGHIDGSPRPRGGYILLDRRDDALVVHRSIELLDVVASAVHGIASRRRFHPRRIGKPLRRCVELERRIVAQPADDGGAMLGEPLVMLEPIELRQRVAPEAAVDLLRQEAVAHRDQLGAERIDHGGLCE